MEDKNKSSGKKGDHAERPREECKEIEQGDHLQEDQREGDRKPHATDDREQTHQGTVLTEPEKDVDEDSERRGSQGRHGTGVGCLSEGAKEVVCHHRPSSHLVAIIPRMKTTAAKTPMTREYLRAVMWSLSTMDARRPSFT